MPSCAPKLPLALAFTAAVLAQPPNYSAASLVNAASNTAERIAPNTIVSLYGTALSTGTAAASFTNGTLPITLAGVTVRLARRDLPLLYVSPTQINFLVDDLDLGGPYLLRLVRSGVTGDAVSLTVQASTPEFFRLPSGYIAATHADGRVITQQQPALPSSVVVLYATGLGATVLGDFKLPRATRADRITRPLDLWLDGQQLPPQDILYAGLTPGYVGLYQVNVRLPDELPPNPALRMGFAGEPSSLSGVRLPTAPAEGSGNASPR